MPAVPPAASSPPRAASDSFWSIRSISSSRCPSSSSGAMSSVEKLCTAVRRRPIVAAACTPCPTTSPTISATRAPASGITSNQSPPTPALAGRYRKATSTALWSGSTRGSRLRWRVTAVWCSRV